MPFSGAVFCFLLLAEFGIIKIITMAGDYAAGRKGILG